MRIKITTEAIKQSTKNIGKKTCPNAERMRFLICKSRPFYNINSQNEKSANFSKKSAKKPINKNGKNGIFSSLCVKFILDSMKF